MSSYSLNTYIAGILGSAITISASSKYRYIYGVTFMNSSIKFKSNQLTISEVIKEVCDEKNINLVEIDASTGINFNQIDKNGKIVADEWYKKIPETGMTLLYFKNLDAITPTSKQFRMIKDIVNFNILKGYKFDRLKIAIVLESNFIEDDLFSNTQIVDIKDIQSL